MPAKSFALDVNRFVEMTLADIDDVLRGALDDTINHMNTPKQQGGRMPVDEGTLRNSLVSGANGAFDPEVSITINTFEIGDLLQFAYVAPYARRMELGFSGADELGRVYNQQGNHFMSTAADMFSVFVDQRIAVLTG